MYEWQRTYTLNSFVCAWSACFIYVSHSGLSVFVVDCVEAVYNNNNKWTERKRKKGKKAKHTICNIFRVRYVYGERVTYVSDITSLIHSQWPVCVCVWWIRESIVICYLLATTLVNDWTFFFVYRKTVILPKTHSHTREWGTTKMWPKWFSVEFSLHPAKETKQPNGAQSKSIWHFRIWFFSRCASHFSFSGESKCSTFGSNKKKWTKIKNFSRSNSFYEFKQIKTNQERPRAQSTHTYTQTSQTTDESWNIKSFYVVVVDGNIECKTQKNNNFFSCLWKWWNRFLNSRFNNNNHIVVFTLVSA